MSGDLYLLNSIFGWSFIFLAFGVVMNFLKPRASEDYRKLKSDMYVAGRIKQFAKKDGIELEMEEKAFKLWLKKNRTWGRDVDEVIESELKERISEAEMKSLKETNK